MTSNVKKLYLYHFFSSIALCAVSNMLFFDKILLRCELKMSQFGLIKGFAVLLPAVLTLVASPLVMRLQLDRIVIAVCYLLRMIIPFLFLVLPFWTKDQTILTVSFSMILMTSALFFLLANNSLQVLCKLLLPPGSIGKHLSWISVVWVLPGAALAIALAKYVGMHANGSDEEFYTAMFHVYLGTTVFQIAASWVIMRVTKPTGRSREGTDTSLRTILEPFRDQRFRLCLNWVFLYSMAVAMVTGFINPYMIDAQRLDLSQISIISFVAMAVGMGLRPMWGHMADRFGGRNLLRVGVLGVATGLFFLTGKGMVFVIVFAVLAWNIGSGLFGTAVTVGRQYLIFSLTHENKSNVYLAAAGIVGMCGVSVGFVAGGVLLEWLKGTIGAADPIVHYRIYYTYCALGILVLGGVATAIRDGRRKVRPAQMGIAMYQTVRGRFVRRR